MPAPADAEPTEVERAVAAWSKDAGLTPAQEKLVEHWSPQRGLDDSRLLRQLVMVVQRWSSTRSDDAGLDEALTILRDLQPQ